MVAATSNGKMDDDGLFGGPDYYPDTSTIRHPDDAALLRDRQGLVRLWTGDSEDEPRRARIVPQFRSAGTLRTDFPKEREPLIEDLVRRGETFNIIGPSKARKSWLTLGLGISVATGRKWWNRFKVHRGKVLVIDNELHPETSSSRLLKVGEAMEIPFDEYRNEIYVESLRGRLVDLFSMADYFDQLEHGAFSLIILDAWYRFFSPETSENSNSDVCRMFNAIDQYARQTGAAFINVHHSSKGDQSTKSNTDVGAGAGAMSRAADVHMALREHADPDCLTVTTSLRSWQPVEPFVIRWNAPLWTIDDEQDPGDIKRTQTRGEARQTQADQEARDKIVTALNESSPQSERKLRKTTGLGPARLERALASAYQDEILSRETTTVKGNECFVYGIKQ